MTENEPNKVLELILADDRKREQERRFRLIDAHYRKELEKLNELPT